MNKFIAMIILKPDIKNKRIDNVQNSILNMFEQNTKVHKIWYLGKKQLDFKNKKYTEGIYLKLDVSAKYKLGSSVVFAGLSTTVLLELFAFFDEFE